MKTAKGVVVFLAAAGIALAAAEAPAQIGGGMRGGRGDYDRDRRPAGEQSPAVQEDPVGLTGYRLETLREDLKLAPEQEPAWKSYADKVSALAADISRERGRLKAVLELKSLQRIDAAVDVARNRLTALEEIASAAKALYARLTPGQQSLADARLATTLPTAAGFSGLAGAGARPGPPR